MIDKEKYMTKDETKTCEESMNSQVLDIIKDISNPSRFSNKNKPDISIIEEEVVLNGDE